MSDAVILIVDDNRPLARSLAELLSRRSFRTLIATTAERALRVARRHHPDLVIADVELPDGSGDELAARLAAESPDARIILVSAGPRPGSDGPAPRSVIATLEKPFDPLRLVALVHQALGRLSEAALRFPAGPVLRLLPMRRAASIRRMTTALARRVTGE